MAVSDVIVTLRYLDAHAAIAFLVDALEFEVHTLHADEETVHHAQLIRPGGGMVMLSTEPEDSGNRLSMELSASSTYVVVDADSEVNRLFARCVGSGAEVIEQPNDPPYGGRSATVRDGEGNYWSVGSYRPQID